MLLRKFIILVVTRSEEEGCQPRPEGSGRSSQAIEVFDLQEKTTTTYISMCEAARALNLPSYIVISMCIKNNKQKPYKGKYTFKKIQG